MSGHATIVVDPVASVGHAGQPDQASAPAAFGFHRSGRASQTLQDRVLPQLIPECRARGRRMRVWSTDCGGGESAYATAITLRRQLPDLADRRL